MVTVPAPAGVATSGHAVAGAVAADAGMVHMWFPAVRWTRGRRASAAPGGEIEHDRHAPVEPAGQPLVAVQVRPREVVP
jgi:hypothetical protein